MRSSVGLIDVGTLGKIEIYGPERREFLDRAYAGRYSDLKVGMTRYGLMLDESGVIVDDGVIARLAEEQFYFTTTTGGSATVFRELLRLNALWGLDCALVNVTGHRAAFNFAGPLSREILQGLTDVDLRDEAFPYLAVRSGQVAGAAARLLRVGFVGELGYEIHVAAGAAADVWQALVTAGRPRGLRPFGVEAQRVLRLEKGHFIVGQDTDGLTDPNEANAMWAVSMKKPFFVGQRSLTHPAGARAAAKAGRHRACRGGAAAQGMPFDHRQGRDRRPRHQRDLFARLEQSHRARHAGAGIGAARARHPHSRRQRRSRWRQEWRRHRSMIRRMCARKEQRPHERADSRIAAASRTAGPQRPARGAMAGGERHRLAGGAEYLDEPGASRCRGGAAGGATGERRILSRGRRRERR